MSKNNLSSNYDLSEPLAPTDSDLSDWLTRQGIRTQGPESPPERGSASPPPEAVPPTAGEGSYEQRFLHRKGAPVRPTHMVHVSERVHRFFSFLAGYTQVIGARVSVPELIENILSEHLHEHERTIERLQQEFSRRNLKAF